MPVVFTIQIPEEDPNREEASKIGWSLHSRAALF